MRSNKTIAYQSRAGTIFNGHALSILKQLQSNSFDMAIVSPPFWSSKEYGLEKQDWGDWRGSIGAEPNSESYVNHLLSIFNQVSRVLKKGGVCWLNIGDSVFKNECGIPMEIICKLIITGWVLIQDFIWLKENIYETQNSRKFTKTHDYVFALSRSTENNFNIYNSWVRKSVWMIEKEKPEYERINLNGKIELKPILSFSALPIELIKNCVDIGCPKNGVILDPFLGSGNTFITAKKMGRKCIGIELSEKALIGYTIPRIKDA